MIISEKQQKANRQNAQHSTGPVTPEGRAAVRFNALTYGLRAVASILPWENYEDYIQLWDELLADWSPANRTERIQLETMATSNWLLARLSTSESLVYQRMSRNADEKFFRLLANIAQRRVQLERSYRIALLDLKQMQKERHAQPQAQPAKTVQTAQPVKNAQPAQTTPAQPPAYTMSEPAEAHPVFCSPVGPDSR